MINLLKMCGIMLIVVALLLSCMRIPGDSRTGTNPECFQNKQWYFFDRDYLRKDTVYYEFVFSEKRLFVSAMIGNPAYDYVLQGDTIVFKGKEDKKHLILSCDCEQVKLVDVTQAIYDTFTLKRFDMAYYYIHQDSIRFNPEGDGLLGHAALMQLKEGNARFEDFDSTNIEVETSFDDILPIPVIKD